jgi:hypothetical protein
VKTQMHIRYHQLLYSKMPHSRISGGCSLVIQLLYELSGMYQFAVVQWFLEPPHYSNAMHSTYEFDVQGHEPTSVKHALSNIDVSYEGWQLRLASLVLSCKGRVVIKQLLMRWLSVDLVSTQAHSVQPMTISSSGRTPYQSWSCASGPADIPPPNKTPLLDQ